MNILKEFFSYGISHLSEWVLDNDKKLVKDNKVYCIFMSQICRKVSSLQFIYEKSLGLLINEFFTYIYRLTYHLDISSAFRYFFAAQQ